MSSDIIPSYPTLYKTKKSGKITEWTLQIFPSSPTCYDLIVKFGEQNGSIQTHVTHITKGKMKRNLLEQSVLEANRKWNDKKREGFVDTLYNHQPFIFRPMLANTFQFNLYLNSPLSKAYKIPFPAYIQKKYDGIRCICKWDENKKNLRFETRNGIEIKILSFHESLISDLHKLFSFENSQKIILDGELFTNDCTFQILNGMIRTGFNQPNFQITSDDFNKIKLIQFHVYDLYDPVQYDMIYEDRYNKLNSFFENNIYSHLKLVETEVASSIYEIKQKHDEYISEGFEGIIIRDKKGIYEVNKRSKYLQKYKEFIEEEFTIVGFHDGEGIDKESVIWECITNNESELIFSVKPKASHEERKLMYKNGEKYIGNQITVIFQEYSDNGIPRFPIGKSIRDIF